MDTQLGYLVLADISGYTSFIARTELEHAQEILSDLLESIVLSFRPYLTIHKLEGDAVFAYVSNTDMSRGESLFELIEKTYSSFRTRRDGTQRHTTCTCRACQNIPSLDLKFIVHFGEYFIQEVMGTKELVSSDVNLVHRLLKNKISDSTGWRAYALFTQQSLEHIDLQPQGLHQQVEFYESLGEVQTSSFNLNDRYQELLRARRVFLPPEEAHVVLNYDYENPAIILWDWFHEPHKRNIWMTTEIVPIQKVGGRNGPGARNHCVHGKNDVVIEDVLDLHPFDYFTIKQVPRGSPFGLLITFQFTPGPQEGTHLCVTFKLDPAPAIPLIAGLLCKFVVRFSILKRWKFEKLDEYILNYPAVNSVV